MSNPEISSEARSVSAPSIGTIDSPCQAIHFPFQ